MLHVALMPVETALVYSRTLRVSWVLPQLGPFFTRKTIRTEVRSKRGNKCMYMQDVRDCVLVPAGSQL